MAGLQGYRGEALVILKDNGVSVGDLIRVVKNNEVYEGILMPRYELADDKHLVIKLRNGYNIGIAVAKSLKIVKIGEGAEPVFKTLPAPEEKPSLPSVAVISTGGTIASRVDYHTGAVRPALSANDLLSIMPELSEIANIRTEVLFSLLSENIRASNWTRIAYSAAGFIEQGIDGVVICHGTDTMGYTAAALSFALQNLPVPIILVGSQRSSDRPSSDASLNLLNAVRAAAYLPMAGVMVCMHEDTSDKATFLHIGTKVRKCHTSARGAFRSVNASPVAKVEDNKINVLRSLLPPRDPSRKIIVKPFFDEKAALLKFFPGMSGEVINWFVENGYRGLVIEGTGLGHVGTYLLDAVDKAVDKGLVIGMTSQCIWGRVNMNVYDTGMYLQRVGVIPLEDMLPETALVKMMWCLGQAEKREDVVRLLRTNIVGEISTRTTILEGLNDA